MAPQILTVLEITRDGVAHTLIAADVDGELIPNTGREFVHYANGDGSPVVITITIVETVDGQTVTNRTVSVPATGERNIGPFLPTQRYNDNTGSVLCKAASITSLTVGAFRL